MLTGFVDEARGRFTVAACLIRSFGRDTPTRDVGWLQFKEFEETFLAGVDLLYGKKTATDSRLIRQDEEGEPLLNEAVDAFFDTGE